MLLTADRHLEVVASYTWPEVAHELTVEMVAVCEVTVLASVDMVVDWVTIRLDMAAIWTLNDCVVT